MLLTIALGALFVVAIDAWASAIVTRRELDPQLRTRQLLFVWCVPVVGAFLVGLAHTKPGALPAPDAAFETQAPITDMRNEGAADLH